MYYCSDITRSIFLGSNKEKDKFRRIYDIVLQAQIKAIDHCKDGAATDEIDRVAREHIAARGYGDNFGHGLGHGVGLEVHEAPILYVTEKKVLKENMVITVEPGIYLEGLGGIRIEDMVIIKKNRCENLYSVTKKLSVID
jgi:Xaa-Pro aminopeptidase